MKPLPTAVCVLSLALAAPALAQPFTLLIDDFSQGGYSYTFNATTFAAQPDQGGLNTLGGRRVSSLVGMPANFATGSQTSATATLNTSSPGTFTFATTGIASPNNVVAFTYRAVALGQISSLMADLNFPGTHGVALDFLNLTAPVTVTIELATITGTGGYGARWVGVVNPSATGDPFRFRTVWNDYTFQPGFTLSQVDQIAVMIRPTPGTTFTIDAIGISPTPGAACVFALGAGVALRRRR